MLTTGLKYRVYLAAALGWVSAAMIVSSVIVINFSFGHDNHTGQKLLAAGVSSALLANEIDPLSEETSWFIRAWAAAAAVIFIVIA
jgi:hypothetical protein